MSIVPVGERVCLLFLYLRGQGQVAMNGERTAEVLETDNS